MTFVNVFCSSFFSGVRSTADALAANAPSLGVRLKACYKEVNIKIEQTLARTLTSMSA